MARDAKIGMRDGLAIPGFLLFFYGVVAIIYAERFRARSDFCPDSSTILIAGLCYSVWKLILPVVLIGLALFISGIAAFRSRPDELEGHLRHGTPSHLWLAFLISLVALPAIAWVIQTVRQGDGSPFELTILGARYEHTFLLELLMLLGVLMLIPFLSLYIAVNVRRRRFLDAADEAMEQEAPEAFAYEDTAQASQEQERDMLPEHAWPNARDGEGAIVSCLATVDGRSCPEPTLGGTRYCARHACQGRTRDGAPCRNMALAGGYCRVHAPSEGTAPQAAPDTTQTGSGRDPGTGEHGP